MLKQEFQTLHQMVFMNWGPVGDMRGKESTGDQSPVINVVTTVTWVSGALKAVDIN